MENVRKAVKTADEVRGMISSDVKKALAKKAGEKLEDTWHTEDDFRKKLGQMPDDELSAAYIPDVYQKDIYMIDYEILKARGIKLISFDMDDTAATPEAGEPSQTAIVLFRDLKRMGFAVALLTNGKDAEGKKFAEKLGADYAAEAEKPYSTVFKAVAFDYEEQHKEFLERSQMAHVGSHFSKDIMGGNTFGITTCLVRRAGNRGKPAAGIAKLAGVNENHIVRAELKNRGLWYAHHQYEKGDQYYQLGEEPGYRRNGRPDCSIALQAADGLIQKVNADRNTVYSLDGLLRNSYKQKKAAAMKTLYAHLGEDIVFTGAEDGMEDMRELEEHELWDGELSAFIFTAGCYSVRQARRLYKDSGGVCYTKREPAGKDAAAAYKERESGSFLFHLKCTGEYREACEISAKYKGEGSAGDEWVHICFADTSFSWNEKIDFICAVKSREASDGQAALFVLKKYIGSSFSAEDWYRFTPDGTVKEYRIHPLNGDTFKERWELN